MGSICHSTSQRHYYFYLPVWPKNANLILTILFLQIVSNLTQLASQGHHPPILWIQLDNPTGENKHKYMLAFASWLIHLGWFKEIVISFLPPGHTHIDIDQMFSTFAIWLLRNCLLFITSVIAALLSAYKKEPTRPSGSFLQTVFNWKGFFAPHMHNVVGITTAHAILVRKQPDGSVGIKFKAWHSSTEPWQGDSHHPSEWLRVLHSFPSGHPPPVPPTSLDIEATLASVRSILPSDTSQDIKIKWEFFFREKILYTQHYERLPDNFWDFTRVRLFECF